MPCACVGTTAVTGRCVRATPDPANNGFKIWLEIAESIINVDELIKSLRELRTLLADMTRERGRKNVSLEFRLTNCAITQRSFPTISQSVLFQHVSLFNCVLFKHATLPVTFSDLKLCKKCRHKILATLESKKKSNLPFCGGAHLYWTPESAGAVSVKVGELLGFDTDKVIRKEDEGVEET